MPLYKYCTSVARWNLGTKKTAALCRFNGFNYRLLSTTIYYYHWGLCVVRAGDCMLDDIFREDAILSRGFFPFAGDLKLTSEVEDLDLPTFNRLRLRELEDTFVSVFVSPPWVSVDVCEDTVSPPVFPLSPAPISLACPFCLHVLSEAFLASKLFFPKSADLRLSLCRRALLKNDNPFSSDLLPRCKSLVDTLGERRLVTEELLLELLTDLLSSRLLSPHLESEEWATELLRRLSTRGLVCIESLLKLLSTSRFRLLVDPFSVTLEFFFAAGEGEAEDWGVEWTPGLCCGVPTRGWIASFVFEGVPLGVEGLFLEFTHFSLVLLTFLPFTGVLEDVSEAEVLWVEHKRFLEVFSCSTLLEFFEEPVLSAFEANPPILLLRFCSLEGVAWVVGSMFWSIAVIWLLFSVGSVLMLFFSTGVGALRYIMSKNLLLLSWSLKLLSVIDRGVLLPK